MYSKERVWSDLKRLKNRLQVCLHMGRADREVNDDILSYAAKDSHRFDNNYLIIIILTTITIISLIISWDENCEEKTRQMSHVSWAWFSLVQLVQGGVIIAWVKDQVHEWSFGFFLTQNNDSPFLLLLEKMKKSRKDLKIQVEIKNVFSVYL